MKKTLLVVMLAVAMIFALATTALAAVSANLTIPDNATAATTETPVDVNATFAGLEATTAYTVNTANDGSGTARGSFTTDAQGSWSGTIQYLPADGWKDHGENAVNNGELFLLKENTMVQSLTVSGKVYVGSDDTTLKVEIAPGQQGTNSVVPPTGESATFTVSTTLDSVSVVLTHAAGAEMDKSSPLTLTADTTVKVTAENGLDVKTYTLKYQKQTLGNSTGVTVKPQGVYTEATATYTFTSNTASYSVTVTPAAGAKIDNGAADAAKTFTLTPAAGSTTATTKFTVTAADGVTTKEYTLVYNKSNVTISDPYTNAAATTALSVNNGYIARDAKSGNFYVKIDGLTAGMTVSSNATQASGNIYKVEHDATSSSITVSVSANGVTQATKTWNVVRPILDYVLVNDREKSSGADKVTFSSNNAATYTFDEDWDDLYVQPVTKYNESYLSVDIEGDGIDFDEWYEQRLKKDSYELEIEVVAKVGSNSHKQTYTLYVSNEDYEGATITNFIANDDDDTKTPYLSFVGSKAIYVFVPYDDRGDDIYFRAQTGDNDDTVYYGSSTKGYKGKSSSFYEGDEDLDSITVEDEYGFKTEYKVHVVTAPKSAEDDADLDDLEMDTGKKSSSIKTEAELSPSFKSSTTSYSVSVDEDQKYGKFTFETADKNAYVFINDEMVKSGGKAKGTGTVELKDGANKFEITVVAEDGEETKTYTVTVNGGTNTELKSLTVSGLTKAASPAFSATQMNYLGYTSAASATITATAANSGCTVTISGSGTKSGTGSATGAFNLANGINVFTVTSNKSGATASTYTVSIYRIPEARTIKVSQQKVTVNGTAKTLNAYNVNGNNFLQLRDIAVLLNGTTKSFAVDFNNSTQTAYMTSGSAYSANGTENAARSAFTNSVVSTQNFYLDNNVVYPMAFNIDGSNYVMLRDMGALLNFGITYNSSTATIAINTNSTYVPGR